MKIDRLLLLLVVILCPPAAGQAQEAFLSLETEEDIIYELCYSSGGGVLAVADGTNIRLYSPPGYELLKEFNNGHNGTILTLDISRDSTLIVSGGTDSTIVIRDLINGEIIKKLACHNGAVTSVRISSDSKYILSGGADGKVNLYDLRKDSLITSVHADKDDVTTVAFLPNGLQYASAGGDGNIHIYSINNMNPDTVLTGHSDWIRHIEFNDSGDRMISCGDDKKLILWDLSRASGIRPLKITSLTKGWLLTSDFHPDNLTYALGSLNGRIWVEGKYGTFSTRLKRPVQCVRINPGSKLFIVIAAATRGSGVKIIDARKMKKL